jgi:hypothetical protein
LQAAENKNFYCYFAQIIFNIVVQFAQKHFNKFSTSNLGKTFVILHKSFLLCEMFLCTLHKNFGLLSNIHDFQQSFQLFNIFPIFVKGIVEKFSTFLGEFSTFQLRAVENFCAFCTKNRVNRIFLLKIFVGMHNFGRARWKIFVQNAQKKIGLCDRQA